MNREFLLDMQRHVLDWIQWIRPARVFGLYELSDALVILTDAIRKLDRGVLTPAEYWQSVLKVSAATDLAAKLLWEHRDERAQIEQERRFLERLHEWKKAEYIEQVDGVWHLTPEGKAALIGSTAMEQESRW